MYSETMVHTIGISTVSSICLIVSIGVGALTTTAKEPCASENKAMFALRLPWVVPPPTPDRIGMVETLAMLWMTAGCGVKG